MRLYFTPIAAVKRFYTGRRLDCSRIQPRYEVFSGNFCKLGENRTGPIGPEAEAVVLRLKTDGGGRIQPDRVSVNAARIKGGLTSME
jgi:hypothetical protein